PTPSRWQALFAGKRRRLIFLGLALLFVAAGTLTPLIVLKSPSPDARPSPLTSIPQQEEASPNLSAMLRRLLLGTVVVLALCVGTLWGGARWLKRREPPKGSQMQVLARVVLDRRSQVFLVRARGQRLLAGVDAGGLKALIPVSALPEE